METIPSPEPRPLPLSALLSQALVAFSIEFDNEFEHRMPHRTTDHGSTADSERGLWLVSMAMWVHCMRHVPAEGVSAGELVARSGLTAESMKMIVRRMSTWWGYLVVEGASSAAGRKPSPATRLIRPTRAGLRAQEAWEPLTDLVEERWLVRFDADRIGRLRDALETIVGRLAVPLPDYPPIGSQSRAWTFDAPATRRTLGPGGADRSGSAPSLSALLSKVLMAFAIDVEGRSELALPLSANVVRVLGSETRVRDLPAMTGLGPRAIDNSLSLLAKRGFVVVGTDPAHGRSKTARLTANGQGAREAYAEGTRGVEGEWGTRYGRPAVRFLREALEAVVGGAEDSPLWEGWESYPEGWRARVPRPDTLPHYPMISHRGGFADGN